MLLYRKRTESKGGGELKKIYNDNDGSSFAVEADNVADGLDSVVIGYELLDKGAASMLISNVSKITAVEGASYNSIFGGWKNEILPGSNYCNIISGGAYNKIKKGSYHFCAGYANTIESSFSNVAFGGYNLLRNIYSVVFGFRNKEEFVTHKENGYNFLSGSYNTITHGSRNGVIGSGLEHEGNSCLVVGQSNSNLYGAESIFNSSTDARFIVGNGILNNDGSSRTRSNAFVIYQSGLIIADSLSIEKIADAENGKVIITKDYLESVINDLDIPQPEPAEQIDNITDIPNRSADDLQNKQSGFNRSFGFGKSEVLEGSEFKIRNEGFLNDGDTVPSRIPEPPLNPESALPANILGIRYQITSNGNANINIDASITYDEFELINNDNFEITLTGINGTSLRKRPDQSLTILPYGRVKIYKIGTYGAGSYYVNVNGDLKAN